MSGERRTQKAATRQRVIDAARSLFDQHGYAETTVRAIAEGAGVSVGSVFTTFASKGEILRHVMAERLDGLYAELDRVAPHLRGSLRDRLGALFSIHFAFELQRPRLFLAHLASTFDWAPEPSANAGAVGRNPRLRQILLDCLTEAMGRGEVRPDADLDAAVETLIAAYVWCYRLAARGQTSAGALSAELDRFVAIIAGGLEVRSDR